MPIFKRLDEAFDEILDAVKATLDAEVKEGGLLEGIETIIRGDRARPRPPTPAIWIFAETATPQQDPRTLAEKWSVPIVLAVVYKSEDPDEGYKESSRLAAKARTALLRNRTLGLREFVQDTRSGRYEPSGPWHRDGSLFGSVAVVDVIFLTME